jgi:hypothetical protein
MFIISVVLGSVSLGHINFAMSSTQRISQIQLYLSSYSPIVQVSVLIPKVVLQIQTRIREDPYNCSGSGSVPRVSRIRIQKHENNKNNLKGELNKEYLLCESCWT